MIIKSVSGIRGIVGNGFTPEFVTAYAAAFGAYTGRGKIIIGRDTRKSGVMLLDAVIAGLLSVGCEVIDLGIVPTPTLLYNVKISDAYGGIVITASHNPSEWNALKLVNKNGEFLNVDEGNELDIIYREGFDRVNSSRIKGVLLDNKGIERHINSALSIKGIDVEGIKKRRFKVGIDCANGAAFAAYPMFLRQLGCDVKEVFCEGNGEFIRKPEPIPENLKVLEKAVKENHLDIGFATDADGDRLSLISENGIAIGEEYTITLALDYWLKRKGGPGVVNYSTTSMVDFIGNKYGVRIFRAKVGEANVVYLMKKVNAPIGGEGNGGVILSGFQYTRDALVGILTVLSLLVERELKISKIINEYPNLKIVKKVVRFNDLKVRDKFFNRVKNYYEKFERDGTDGIKVFKDNGWIHIRKSGTEPIIRLIAESGKREDALGMIEEAYKIGEM